MCDCQNWKKYTFHIRSMEQIDWTQIESELSHKNPVMMVEVEGIDGVRVLIDQTIWQKSYNSGDIRLDQTGKPVRRHLERLSKLYALEDDNGFVSKEVAGKMIRVIRKIRKLQWEEPHRACVNVSKVRV